MKCQAGHRCDMEYRCWGLLWLRRSVDGAWVAERPSREGGTRYMSRCNIVAGRVRCYSAVLEARLEGLQAPSIFCGAQLQGWPSSEEAVRFRLLPR